jgi:hypothetical protein
MHSVELLDEALTLAGEWGYSIRQEWLGGSGGGGCEIKGRKWIFIDLSLTPAEQCEQVVEALREDDRAEVIPFPVPLRRLLRLRRAA